MTRTADPDAGDALAAFAGERPRLRALAYRLLGSVADAEDTLQDAWLRWSAVASGSVASPPAFLTTLVTRLALDRMRSARAARERYYGLWLPEPDVTGWPGDAGEGDAEAGETVPMAMLLLLERLGPEQRAVFVLREAMDLDYAEIASVLGKSADACRQVMRRARARLSEPAAAQADLQAGRRIADAFAAASLRRDYAAIVSLLADDAQWLSDGGGLVLTAVNPLHGADRIARFLLGIQRKRATSFGFTAVRVNGAPGFLTRLGDRFQGVWALDIADGRIRRIYQVANPRKLGHIALGHAARGQTALGHPARPGTDAG
ncbi:RNA polymerase sigma factor SigJ [Azospirillum picis]|uniref:RNA polymerase sigma-70 factor (ECF subfamily) n=1 Tax=Azospirillum picis TaxID=488438 RepID=A0ABU0MPA5_9PROT|nr:RNA polymerase sigma factor SigJ [Azospirillum picis]MBP2301471.1 RNA polymerase sigma-70 factor (ECF subfamily) [Azospirillum picis]MDQ0535303.1 RNA polymerase sigma-70 factor (ECF subfamily) [Azospirillum picis]